jgi:hypothetical protein
MPRRPNRGFQFHKRTQLFICSHNEALSVAAMRRPQSRLPAARNELLIHSSTFHPALLRLLPIISAYHFTPVTQPHTIGVNSIFLHRGHLPAVSNVTGVVKCLIYWHSLHFHRIERCSCDCSICFNAFMALSRIASRSAFSVLTLGSTGSAPTVQVCRLICAIFAPTDDADMLSCSDEHIRTLDAVYI